MRKVSTAVKALLASANFQTYYLFHIRGKGLPQDIRYTTLGYDIDIPHLGGLFDSSHSILEFQPPRMASASDREAYRITFTDPDFDFRAIAELNLLGARATFYMGAMNTFDYQIGSAQPGQPLIQSEDIIVGFDGVIDSKEYTINPFENINTFAMECSSPMASLGISRPYVTSKQAVQQLDSVDTAYDQVYDGSKGVSLLWGK